MCSCGEEKILIPKPRMYPKITWPERTNIAYQNVDCGFTFSYPNYFNYVPYTSNKPLEESNGCWFNLTSTSLNSTIFFSYYSIQTREDLDKQINDAFEMVGKHNIKANARSETIFTSPATPDNLGVSCMLFEISGPVATPMQFFMTDSTNHFLRASLYFNSTVNPDSTQVVYDFIKEDVVELIESFEWN